jgi:hypothetical protein
MSSVERPNRPLTPPEDTLAQNKKTRVLADMNDDPIAHKYTAANTTDPPPSSKATRTFNDTQDKENPWSGSTSRTDVTQRIEGQVWSILRWENPMRSIVVLASIMGSLILTRSYSLLQIVAALSTLAIGLNLVYVTFVVQTQRVFSDQGQPLHPYRSVIGNKEQLTAVNRDMVMHYSSLVVDIAETVIRGLARIVFIEDSKTSLKWLAIFYLTWTVSAHLSSRTILGIFTISAFIFPRLYISNKGIVDAHIQQGETVLRKHFSTAQNIATSKVQDAYASARAYMATSGTTATDGINSLKNEAVAEKTD